MAGVSLVEVRELRVEESEVLLELGDLEEGLEERRVGLLLGLRLDEDGKEMLRLLQPPQHHDFTRNFHSFHARCRLSKTPSHLRSVSSRRLETTAIIPPIKL